MKASVLSLDGKKVKDITLPKQFNTGFRPDVIRRAFLSAFTSRLQPMNNAVGAGRNNTAEFQGRRRKYSKSGAGNAKGHARLPRLKNLRFGFLGKVASVPQAVGGPRAHGPKLDKTLKESINNKERRLAIRSGIAATTRKELVTGRGHVIADSVSLPIVVEDSFNGVKKTSEAAKVLSSVGVLVDVDKAKAKKKVRAGKGTMRGRRYKSRKGPLVVITGKADVVKAVRNLEGVDVVDVRNLNAELLAPGSHAGRLTVWTEGAVKVLEENKLFL